MPPPGSNTSTPVASNPIGESKETLSQFLAKILDQLSVSAWLPAAFLVFGVLLLGHIRNEDGNVTQALTNIANIGWPAIVLLLGAVILATTIAQAFQFEAIRLLEGYWGGGRPWSALAGWRCNRHYKARDRLDARRNSLERKAFGIARERMLEKHISRPLVDVIEDNVMGNIVDVPDEVVRAAESIQWHEFSKVQFIRAIDELDVRIGEYPSAVHRVLPTRLGNTLRAYEERASEDANGDLEIWVMRIFDRLPLSLQISHDQFRSRLDLYCSLVLVAGFLGAVGIALLYGRGWAQVAWAAGIAVAMAWLVYRAAIASGRAYGGVLLAIRNWEENQPLAAES